MVVSTAYALKIISHKVFKFQIVFGFIYWNQIEKCKKINQVSIFRETEVRENWMSVDPYSDE